MIYTLKLHHFNNATPEKGGFSQNTSREVTEVHMEVCIAREALNPELLEDSYELTNDGRMDYQNLSPPANSSKGRPGKFPKGTKFSTAPWKVI